VYSSFSWSVNVLGRKRWLLFPPGEELAFKDDYGYTPDDVEKKLNSTHIYCEIIQSPGQAIFVPSGWFHQVINLEDTISINHNWVNGCNIHHMWNALKVELEILEREIYEYSETDGWSDHCQVMLKALFGMNITEFVDFIKHISNKRLESLTNDRVVEFEQWKFERNHIIFDLKAIHKLLKDITSDILFKSIKEFPKIVSDIEEILQLD